jgi:hypothetical protein
MIPSLPRLYRRFPVSSAFSPASFVLKGFENDTPATSSLIMALPTGGAGDPATVWNKGLDVEPFDLYKPRFVRGTGSANKEGMCPICIESVERGGEGVEKWMKVKSLAERCASIELTRPPCR